MQRIKKLLFRTLLTTATIFIISGIAWGNDTYRYAELGDFRLESGAVIRNCRLAYSTFGTLNADKSNAILVPTWLAGTSQELADIGFIGPGKLFDSKSYYIIAVDAFGNGISSSPANSSSQRGLAFPPFSIGDMVLAQHTLLTKHLNIRHLHAVAGISMGALQVYQWMVSYPTFMDMAIPILGSPWLTSYDQLIWSTQLAILDTIRTCKGNQEAMKALTPLHTLLAWPPEYRAANTKPEAFAAFLKTEQERLSKYDATNWASQARAIFSHNIRKGFGGSREKTAAAVQARSLVINSPQDRLIYPNEAQAFARMIGAQSAELDGKCGHFAFLCDQENLKALVNTFLSTFRNR